jgi:hypothetical protein
VLVEFVQDGCPACDPKALDDLAQGCASTNATFLRVECSQGFGSELADALKVDGTPTALLADSAEALRAGKVKEVDPEAQAAQLKRKFKCAR